jgi:hypothetical protein
MPIDQHDRPGIYREGNGDEHGSRNEGTALVLVRALRVGVGSEETGRGSSEGLPESSLQEPVLEPTPTGRGPEAAATGGQEATPQEGLARRQGPARVKCNHCGALVLTRNSHAMWGHQASGKECPGSRSWDYA